MKSAVELIEFYKWNKLSVQKVHAYNTQAK